jgi:hypothetical protein
MLPWLDPTRSGASVECSPIYSAGPSRELLFPDFHAQAQVFTHLPWTGWGTVFAFTCLRPSKTSM